MNDASGAPAICGAGDKLYWNTAETLAWIATRDLAFLAEVSHYGASLRLEVKVNLWRAGDRLPPGLSIADAERDLIQRLKNDKLRAIGTRCGRGGRERIGAEHWGVMEFAEAPFRAQPCNPDGTFWGDLGFLREEVMALWTQRAPIPGGETELPAEPALLPPPEQPAPAPRAPGSKRRNAGRKRGPYGKDLKSLLEKPEIRNALVPMSGRQRAEEVRVQWVKRGFKTKLPAKGRDDTALRTAIARIMGDTEDI